MLRKYTARELVLALVQPQIFISVNDYNFYIERGGCCIQLNVSLSRV